MNHQLFANAFSIIASRQERMFMLANFDKLRPNAFSAAFRSHPDADDVRCVVVVLMRLFKASKAYNDVLIAIQGYSDAINVVPTLSLKEQYPALNCRVSDELLCSGNERVIAISDFDVGHGCSFLV
jgi:hypothetical protein